MKPLSVVIVISHPIQHFVPVFRYLRQFEDLKVTVCYYDYDPVVRVDLGFGSDEAWDIDLTSGYEFVPLRCKASGLARLKCGWQFLRNVSRASPDAILISGYVGLFSRLTFLAHFWRRPIIHYADSELLHKRSFRTRAFKKMLLPLYFLACKRVLYIGDENLRYYRHYGVPNRKLVRSVCPIDLVRFKTTMAKAKGEASASLRRKWRIDEDATVLLFIGRFVAIKRPEDVVQAVASLKPSDPKVVLLMIGNGPSMQDVKAAVAAHDVEDRVRVVGFVNQSEMPAYMQLGDILISASEVDPHPLVITEAMAAGNAVIASDRVGCVGAGDTARPGENALVFKCGDPADLARAIHRMTTEPSLLKAMQVRSLAIAETQDALVAAKSFRRAALESV